MSRVAQERHALVETLHGADPDAPTLDHGRDVRRLVAYLAQREQDLVARPGEGVTLTGEPEELALRTSGRRGAAHVELTGAPDALAPFRAWAA